MVKENMPASRMRHRRFLPTVALAAGLLLSGCEFLGLDIFPATLQNAKGSIDLDSRVAGQDGAAISSVEEIVRLSSSAAGKAYLFVLCGTDLGARLIVLDPESLATEAYLSASGLGTPLAVDASGYFVAGSARIDPSSLAPVGTDFSSGAFLLPAASMNLLLSGSNGALNIKTCDAAWSAAPVALPISGISVTGSASTYNLVDAELSEDGALLLLFHDTSQHELELGFSDYSHFAASIGSLSAAADTKTELSGIPDSRAWLCAGGIVAPSYDNDSRLVRYGYGKGASLDSRQFRSEWVRGLSFDYGEKGWYYYDSRSGRLYAMGVWW